MLWISLSAGRFHRAACIQPIWSDAKAYIPDVKWNRYFGIRYSRYRCKVLFVHNYNGFAMGHVPNTGRNSLCDRPNPIGGTVVGGNIIEKSSHLFWGSQGFPYATGLQSENLPCGQTKH